MHVAQTPHYGSGGGKILDYTFSGLGEEKPGHFLDDPRDVNMRNLVTC